MWCPGVWGTVGSWRVGLEFGKKVKDQGVVAPVCAGNFRAVPVRGQGRGWDIHVGLGKEPAGRAGTLGQGPGVEP